MNLELIQKKGFEGLRVKTKDQEEILASLEDTAKLELGKAPELVIVSTSGTFRACIFAFTHGEILLETELPSDLMTKPRFEMAILRERKNPDRNAKDSMLRETMVLLGAPVTGSTSRRKIRILQMTSQQYEQLNKLLSK